MLTIEKLTLPYPKCNLCENGSQMAKCRSGPSNLQTLFMFVRCCFPARRRMWSREMTLHLASRPAWKLLEHSRLPFHDYIFRISKTVLKAETWSKPSFPRWPVLNCRQRRHQYCTFMPLHGWRGVFPATAATVWQALFFLSPFFYLFPLLNSFCAAIKVTCPALEKLALSM